MQAKQHFQKIQQSDSTFRISVSHTTRKARPNEVDGVDYHFVSKDEFKILLKKKLSMSTQKFLVITTELQKSVDEIVKKNFNVLFDIDWKGAKQLSEFDELNFA